MWRWQLIQPPVSCANQNLSPAIGSMIGHQSWGANENLNLSPAKGSMNLSPAKGSMNPSHGSSR